MATEFGINESFGTSDDGCTTLWMYLKTNFVAYVLPQ